MYDTNWKASILVVRHKFGRTKQNSCFEYLNTLKFDWASAEAKTGTVLRASTQNRDRHQRRFARQRGGAGIDFTNLHFGRKTFRLNFHPKVLIYLCITVNV
jgi:hypothetical protein